MYMQTKFRCPRRASHFATLFLLPSCQTHQLGVCLIKLQSARLHLKAGRAVSIVWGVFHSICGTGSQQLAHDLRTNPNTS